jgi:branched-chain amino acid transport system ATP-binding protein
MLQIRNARILYGRAIEAVRDVSLDVAKGRVVALLGTNGAGKSTILKAVTGLLASEDGEVVSGSVTFEGQSLLGQRPDAVMRHGIALVPEGRRLFTKLTVRDNLVMGGFIRSRGDFSAGLDSVIALFPALGNKLDRTAGFLSGGEQQMVAIGRALLSGPRLLMLDEPSLGLAPLIVEEIFASLRRLRDERGLTILVIEQNARLALSLADDGYILENGRIMLDGTAAELAANPVIRSLYLGMTDGGTRHNLRDTAPMRQRVRWPA